jgi:hypothetical protein
MRALYLLILIYITIVISGCSYFQSQPQQPIDTAITQQPVSKKMAVLGECYKKNPIDVALYIHENPNKPYIVIGKEIISKYNLSGIKRQTACLHDTMRNLAASMGGDAVMNIRPYHNKIIATVIAYNPNQLTPKNSLVTIQ